MSCEGTNLFAQRLFTFTNQFDPDWVLKPDYGSCFSMNITQVTAPKPLWGSFHETHSLEQTNIPTTLNNQTNKSIHIVSHIINIMHIAYLFCI